MRTRRRSSQFALLLFMILAVTSVAKPEDILYTDGPPDGTLGAFPIFPTSLADIVFNFDVEDSFSLTSASTLSSIVFGDDLPTGSVASSVDWAIVAAAGSHTPVCSTCSGTAALTVIATYPVTAGPYVGDEEQFTLPDINLSAGTYWLELHDESITPQSSGVMTLGGWDLTGGPSQVWVDIGLDSAPDCLRAGTCANSFTIYGPPDTDTAPNAAPEPSSFALLGSGFTLLATRLRRRRNVAAIKQVS